LATNDETSEVEYWKARYEAERERLTKLWVAYKALEAESSNAPRAPQP
jgi:hypothetical protein